MGGIDCCGSAVDGRGLICVLIVDGSELVCGSAVDGRGLICVLIVDDSELVVVGTGRERSEGVCGE